MRPSVKDRLIDNVRQMCSQGAVSCEGGNIQGNGSGLGAIYDGLYACQMVAARVSGKTYNREYVVESQPRTTFLSSILLLGTWVGACVSLLGRAGGVAEKLGHDVENPAVDLRGGRSIRDAFT